MDKLFRRIVLNVYCHDQEVIKSYSTFVKNASTYLGIESGDVIKLPYTRWIQWALKSKFAKKKYKLHYETRTYEQQMSIYNVTGSTASTFLEYVERNIPEGLGLKVSYEEICPLPHSIANNAVGNGGTEGKPAS